MIPFTDCSNVCVSGSTGAGKSWWVYRLLKCESAFVTKPQKILYCYGQFQELLARMENEFPNITMHDGIPSTETLQEFADGQHNVVVLDDLQSCVVNSPTMERLFTQFSHHLRFSVIFLTQNPYVQGKYSRTLFLNMHVLVLFKSMRCGNQIIALGKDMFPGKGQILSQAYDDAVMQNSFGYLVVDTGIHCDPKHRLRTRIFCENGQPTVVYVPRI